MISFTTIVIISIAFQYLGEDTATNRAVGTTIYKTKWYPVFLVIKGSSLLTNRRLKFK